MISLDYAKTTLFILLVYIGFFKKNFVFIMYIYKDICPAAFTEAKCQ